MLRANLFSLAVVVALSAGQVAKPAASIAGRVLDAASNEPLVAATILITALDAASGTPSLSPVYSGERGEFSFTNLPPGRYSLSARKPRYLYLGYGQRPGSGLPGVSVTVTVGQQIKDLVIRLPLASVIAGTVTDSRGEPAQGASVQVWRLEWRNGERAAQQKASDVVDDRGQYRIPNLFPGDYLVLAQMAAPAPPRPAPTYYPGTPVSTQASAVPLGVSEERTGINIQMSAVVMSTVEGAIGRADGQPVQNVKISAVDTESERRGVNFQSTSSTANARFRFENLPPGRYELLASEPNETTTQRWATATVVADGNPIKDIALVLREGETVSGIVAVGGPTPPKSSPRVTLSPLDRDPSTSASFSVRSEVDGRFSVKGVLPGRYVMGVSDVPTGYLASSIQVAGRDVTDLPIEVGPLQQLAGFEVKIIPVGASVSGTLFDSSGRPNSDLLVIVFPADEKYWLPASRRIQTARPDSNGQYSVRSLPPGSYAVGVVTDAEPGEWFAPSFLKKLVPTSISLSLAGAESKTLDVRVK